MITDQYGTGESHAFLQLEADGRDSGGAARWKVATETQKRTPVMRTSAQVFRRICSQASDVLPAPPLAIEARVVQFKDDTSKPYFNAVEAEEVTSFSIPLNSKLVLRRRKACFICVLQLLGFFIQWPPASAADPGSSPESG